MRIAVLQDDYPPYHEGGSGAVAREFAVEFSRRGHTILVITAVRDRELAGRSKEDGCTIERIYTARSSHFRAYWSVYDRKVTRRVKEALEEFRPDIVHVHNLHNALSYGCLPLARRYSRRVMMTVHDTMMIAQGKLPNASRGDREAPVHQDVWRQIIVRRWRYNPLRIPLIKYLLRRNIDEMAAVSGALQQALRANGIDCGHVIHNGIDVARWGNLDGVQEFRERFAVKERVVLFGGRLSAAKGAHAMLEAFALANARVPSAQLLVVGSENVVARRMAARARELGIAHNVIFAGWLRDDDIRHAYAASALVAVPSLYLDPFPTVNLEALASRRAVIATKWGGSPEIIEDGVCGSIVDPLDTASFATAIQRLLEDDALRGQFAEAGYERVANEFSLAKQTDRYETLFAASLSTDDSATKRRS